MCNLYWGLFASFKGVQMILLFIRIIFFSPKMKHMTTNSGMSIFDAI